MNTSVWTKWISEPGHIRAVAIEATALMKQLCEQQQLEGLGQVGLSDAVLGSLLIASAHKSNEAINMNVQGSGPFRQAIIDASPEGRVRGFLIEQKDASMHTFGEHGTNGSWGSGILSILYTKNFEGKMPYTGMVPISTGFMDEAINDYYRDSEQQVARIGLYVEFANNRLHAARGVLLQAMGGASEEELKVVGALRIQDLRALANDMKPENAGFERIMPTCNFRKLETQPLQIFCNCSQERIERALVLSGESAIIEALADDPALKITCDFCRTEYQVSRTRVVDLFTTDSTRLQ